MKSLFLVSLLLSACTFSVPSVSTSLLMDDGGSDMGFDMNWGPAPQIKRMKIMPAGDSNTDGLYVPGGYRPFLKERLSAAGIKSDFVGSLQNDQGDPLLERDYSHEGHPGYVISQLASLIDGPMAEYQPDIVALMIGKNDANQAAIAGNFPSPKGEIGVELASLVDKILADCSHDCRVVLISDPPSGAGTAIDPYDQELNGYMPPIAAARYPEVEFCSLANVNTAYLQSDWLHYKAPGYDEIAEDIYTCIARIEPWRFQQ